MNICGCWCHKSPGHAERCKRQKPCHAETVYDELAYFEDEHFKALERTILPNPPKFVIYQTPYKQPNWLWKYFQKS